MQLHKALKLHFCHIYDNIELDSSNYQEGTVVMAQKLFFGEPKYEKPFQDYPVVHPKGSISEWVENLPTIDDTPTNDMPEFTPAVLSIKDGEGWYTKMAQMGITDPIMQFKTLQIAGPKLQDIGIAYALEDGAWGIKNTEHMPEEAIVIIWESSQLV